MPLLNREIISYRTINHQRILSLSSRKNTINILCSIYSTILQDTIITFKTNRSLSETIVLDHNVVCKQLWLLDCIIHQKPQTIIQDKLLLYLSNGYILNFLTLRSSEPTLSLFSFHDYANWYIKSYDKSEFVIAPLKKTKLIMESRNHIFQWCIASQLIKLFYI